MAEPTLKATCRLCCRCGAEAEVLSGRALTEADLAELAGAQGPVVYAYLLLCHECGHPWLVLAGDTGEWYAPGGGD